VVSTLDFQSVIPGSNPDSAKLYSLFKFNQIEIKMWRKRQSHGFEPHHRQTDKLYVGRGSSELVLLASQLTKPLKVKRLFSPLVWFLKISPEAPRGIDLKRENTNSILIITNLICWLLVS
jgi:hypothetical protein